MTTSRRLADRKSAKFQKNVLKRGSVPESSTKKGSSYPVGPIVLGFFVFVVIGSAVLQIFRTAPVVAWHKATDTTKMGSLSLQVAREATVVHMGDTPPSVR